LDTIRPTTLKAEYRRSDPVGSSDPIGPTLADVIETAVIQHYGSVKAAAISLRVDPSLMRREFQEWKFRRLATVDGETKAAIAAALTEAFGPLAASPQQKARQSLRLIRDLTDELEQFLDFLAR
jgi:hypothetical protein